MSETDIDREPIEIVEIITPKCANVYGSGPCTASGSAGEECFNTRSTCQDTDNFQARPISHLVPDLILEQEETGAQSLGGDDTYLFETLITIPLEPQGVVFAIGDIAGGASREVAYVEFLETGDLRVAAGQIDNANARIQLDIDSTPYLGKTYSMIVEWTRDPGVDKTVTVYLFDPILLELIQIGTGSSVDDSNPSIFADGLYGFGVSNDIPPTTGSDQTYNNFLDSGRFYANQTAVLFVEQNMYRNKYYFDDGREAVPTDDIYIYPLLQGSSSVGSRINVSGSDDRYEPLGRRAYFECTMLDAPDSDYPIDPYRTTRPYDPLLRGKFWVRWLAREKFGRTRALVRRYTGYAGESLADMRSQTYVLDQIARGNDAVSIKARDVISLTEFRRAQVPAPTSAPLDVLLTDSATELFVAGDVTDQFKTTGTISINDELMTYTGMTYDAVDDQTDFTGLTRGTDGSEAAEHDVEDNVQNCRRYTAATIDEVVSEFLVTDARIPAQLINLAKIATQSSSNLGAYTVSTVIREPTGVDQLLGELAESCAFYIWWNERDQVVDMQAIQPLSGVDAEFSDEENVVMGSISIEERPKERISTLNLYYNPRNFADDLDKPFNYKNQIIVATSANNDVDQYADLPQIREVFSRWLVSNAQANQTGSRYVTRYQDIPIYVTHDLDAKDRAIWTGKFVSLSTDEILTETGERDVRRFLVVYAEETKPGHQQRVILADITLDGRIFTVTTDLVTTYTAELFAAGNAFITDNEGLNPDGTRGATIG